MPNLAKVTDDVTQRWRQRLSAAQALMRSREPIDRVLIEVAAQHPLTEHGSPGPEFEARLQRGFSLFREIHAQGVHVEIYVPGSRHRFEGREDPVSLSASGSTYLQELGVPPDRLHGEDLNARYKGSAGVYGSADECFVSARYFLDQNFGRIYSVVSPSQMLRKTLHYIAFGILPLNVTAPVTDSYHDYLYELFEAIPHVLLIDDTLQGDASQEGHRLRNERRPQSP